MKSYTCSCNIFNPGLHYTVQAWKFRCNIEIERNTKNDKTNKRLRCFNYMERLDKLGLFFIRKKNEYLFN